MNCLEKFVQLEKDEIKPFLKQHGFKKSGSNYYKQTEDLIRFITTTKSSWNSKDSCSFDFIMHVFDPVGFRFLKEDNEVLPKLPYNTKYSIIEITPGELGRSSKLAWYEITDTTDMTNLWEQIKNDFTQYALPFLNRFNDKEDLLNEYSKTGTETWRAKGAELYAGLHFLDRGKKEEGIQKIRNCKDRWVHNDFWQKKLRVLLEKVKGVG